MQNAKCLHRRGQWGAERGERRGRGRKIKCKIPTTVGECLTIVNVGLRKKSIHGIHFTYTRSHPGSGAAG